MYNFGSIASRDVYRLVMELKEAFPLLRDVHPEFFRSFLSDPAARLHSGPSIKLTEGYGVFREDYLKSVKSIEDVLRELTVPTFIWLEFHSEYDSDCSVFPGSVGWHKYILKDV